MTKQEFNNLIRNAKHDGNFHLFYCNIKWFCETRRMPIERFIARYEISAIKTWYKNVTNLAAFAREMDWRRKHPNLILWDEMID